MAKKPKCPGREAITKIMDDRDKAILANIQAKSKPIQPQEPTQAPQEFSQGAIEKMAESLGILADLPDYESPEYSSARIHMQAIKAASETPIPREDEARPCSLCESRRPIGTSYSRVYCTKSNARYCKCSYCGHTWTQERK